MVKIKSVGLEYSKGELFVSLEKAPEAAIQAERHAFKKELKALGKAWNLSVRLQSETKK